MFNTPFDGLFDLDNDGKLDWLERGARDAFIMNMIDSIDEEDEDQDN